MKYGLPNLWVGANATSESHHKGWQWRTLLVLLCSPLLQAAAFNHSHQALTDVFKNTVQWNAAGTATAVDYAALKASPGKLNAYTDTLSAVSRAEFDAFTVLQRRAFLINAYNAFTVQLILSKYPDLKSIKDLGSLLRSPWKQAFIKFLGKTVSLDEIEHDLLRGSKEYNDPRIHFAVNCASIGCPALRPEAFIAERLDAQLLDQTQRFLRDRTRNYYDPRSDTLYLSSIFDWYGSDFERGYLGANSVPQFLASYAASLGINHDLMARLKRGDIDLDYTDYDWQLNATDPAQAAVSLRIDQLYRQIEASVADVPAIDAVNAINGHHRYTMVDVRDTREQAVSVIPGAMTMAQFSALAPAKRQSAVLVYCTIGYRSGLVARTLRARGIAAHNLRGGILSWIAAGGTVVDNQLRLTRKVHVYAKNWAVVPNHFTAIY